MIRRLIRNERGAAIIEIAVALPTLIIMLWSIVQAGLVFRAMSGIQHGLGEGARYATLYPQPSTDDIKNKISSTVYGIGIMRILADWWRRAMWSVSRKMAGPSGVS